MEFLANLHPKIVHFPLAFLMLYPVMELIFILTKKDFFTKAATLFLIIGTLGALMAVFTGNQAYTFIKNWNNESTSIFNLHQNFANLTMWFFTGLLIIKIYWIIKRKVDVKKIIVLFLLSLIGCYLVYQTGNFGGKLAEKIIMQQNSDLNNTQ